MPNYSPPNHAILLISCPDQKGITAAVTQFVFEHRGNIIHADQHIDGNNGAFFMRIEWQMDDFQLNREELSCKFDEIAQRFSMEWTVHFTTDRMNAAIFVSKPMHCLYDLLSRHSAGQLNCDIPVIVSNHPEAESVAQKFEVPFVLFEITPSKKDEIEKKQIQLMQEKEIDLIILARYHQILSESFVESYPRQIINIHHSFLPAFAGKNPYQRAFEKGVKLIGATSHYVTAELDQGPIIEQDTVRISHRDKVSDLIRKGQDLEKVVLSRAVRWHLEKKILAFENKTVVFD